MHRELPATRRTGLWRMLSVLFGTILFGEAIAQTPPYETYPWDTRPALCFQAAAPADPRCKWNNWPTWNDTIQRVTYLYTSEKYALLERAMHELAASREVFVSGDSPAAAAYWAFRRLITISRTHEDLQERIARWAKAVPASDYATFAQARLMYIYAWRVRGQGTSDGVSRESWELFSVRLQEAEQVLLNAPEGLKQTPHWYNLLLAIILDSPDSKSNVEAVFQEAVARWPRYFEFYELRLTRLVPKWGGSWEQVESFIDTWSQRLAPSEGNSAYARLYLSVAEQGVSPGQTRMDWTRMKAGLEDLTDRYPTRNYKNLHASYACHARDKAAFSAAIARLSPDELSPGSWLSGHSYEACMKWAGI